jgi:hypothetical protein
VVTSEDVPPTYGFTRLVGLTPFWRSAQPKSGERGSWVTVSKAPPVAALSAEINVAVAVLRSVALDRKDAA